MVETSGRKPIEPSIRKTTEYIRFTDREIERSGGVAYDLQLEQVQTIQNQQDNGVSFKFHPKSKEYWRTVLASSPISAQVIIWPDPQEFLIPNSKDLDLVTQEALLKEDEIKMRKRTGFGEDIVEIIPEQASTFTTLMLKHYKKTGIWLLGPRYGHELGLYGLGVFARTKNPLFGSAADDLAIVGFNHPGIGIEIGNSGKGKNGRINLSEDRHIYVVRMAIKLKI